MGYKIGDIRSGFELGYKSNMKHIWAACEACGKERWVQYANGKAVKSVCGSCAQKVSLDKKSRIHPVSLATRKAIETGNKKCNKCGNLYPANEEYFNTGKGYLGIRSPCRQCSGKRAKAHRLKTDQQKFESSKDYNDYLLKHHPYRILSPIESKLHTSMRSAICVSLKGNKKGRAWESLVGYTTKQLKKHLEKQFANGMSWDNHGKCTKGNAIPTWHIDHIIPKSAFNITSVDDFDFKRCWSLSNPRPMWGVENCRKSKSILYPFQFSL